MTSPKPSSREPALLAVSTVVLLALSAVGAKDPTTWWMEVAPILVVLPLLAATYSRFRFTPLAYRLIFVHAIILMVGGHYTYAEVPLGFWVRDALGLVRNNYDRLGHLAQGFVPAIVAREVLSRRSPLRDSRWMLPIVTSFCLSISACYEFVEWGAALALGQGADAFLGSQGDPWDTQWDMFSALCGALLAQLLLARLHDRQITTALSRRS